MKKTIFSLLVLGGVCGWLLGIGGTHAQLPSTSLSNGSGAPTGLCTSGSSYTDSSTGNGWACTGGVWKLSSTSGILTGTTGSIGGGVLLVGASASGTATITGAAPGMVCDATPTDGTDFASLGATVSCTVTATNTVTVRVMAVVGLTPSSKTYNVRVIP